VKIIYTTRRDVTRRCLTFCEGQSDQSCLVLTACLSGELSAAPASGPLAVYHQRQRGVSGAGWCQVMGQTVLEAR
jgi:hypothetical protein